MKEKFALQNNIQAPFCTSNLRFKDMDKVSGPGPGAYSQ
jgi:hypothetical protein